MFDLLGEATHARRSGRKSISTTNGGRFATTRGARLTHKSSVDNLVTVLQHRFLVALILAKDPCRILLDDVSLYWWRDVFGLMLTSGSGVA